LYAFKYSAGIDISYKTFRACLVTYDDNQEVKVVGSKKFDNTNGGFKLFEKWYLNKHKYTDLPMHFCMEATGVYHENLAHYLHSKGQKVSIILANKARKYLDSLGLKSKTDPIDARGLAQMGAERKLKVWDPPADFFAELRCITRHHQSLQELKTAQQNILHAHEASSNKAKLVKKQLKQTIKSIDKQLERLKEELSIQVDKNPDIRRKVDQICKIKGIGELTVCVIIAETYGFELFNSAKQLISYSGYDVIENQSGKHVGKTRISKKGNSRIRRALFLPAFNAVSPDQPIFYNLFTRTLDKHKIKMKSYVAVQKKLLTTIYALWKNEEDFIKDYHLRKKEQKVAPNKRELHQVLAR
jgi:transposase